MVDQASYMTVKFWDDHISNALIALGDQLRNEKLRVPALCELTITSLQLFRDLNSLWHGRVLQSALNCSDRVMLEHKIVDSSGYDFEQLGKQLLSLFLRHIGFDTESFPDLLGSVDLIGVWF